MNLRHLHCFIAVAEELHFGRAAERLHIEQSPLSRTIKRLESELGVTLFDRSSRETRLTWAGQVFLEDARRILLIIEQAKASAKAAAAGFRGQLRIALSDWLPQPRLTALLALCREEEPDVEIRLVETSAAQQIHGLRSDLYGAGFTLSEEPANGIVAKPVWSDALMVVMPSRHPLLAHKQVSLNDALNYPVVLRHRQLSDGFSLQLERLLRSTDKPLIVAERVNTHELMIALVAAGYGIAFCTDPYFRHTEVVTRPLAECDAVLTTYLVRHDLPPSGSLANFLDRVDRLAEEKSAIPV